MKNPNLYMFMLKIWMDKYFPRSEEKEIYT